MLALNAPYPHTPTQSIVYETKSFLYHSSANYSITSVTISIFAILKKSASNFTGKVCFDYLLFRFTTKYAILVP